MQDQDSALEELDEFLDKQQFKRHQRSGTQGSAYEYLVPELMFSTTEDPVEGVSAVKALTTAVGDGQRIYHLTQSNMEQLNNISIDSEVRIEIRSALLAGKEVTVHESPINTFGWTGSGYIIFDPITGSGAYKISGGANGGMVALSIIGLIGLAFSFLVFGLVSAAIATGGALLATILLAVIAGSIFIVAELILVEVAASLSAISDMASLMGLIGTIGVMIGAVFAGVPIGAVAIILGVSSLVSYFAGILGLRLGAVNESIHSYFIARYCLYWNRVQNFC